MIGSDPRVIFETSKLRCVLMGRRSHQTAKNYVFEEKTKDAMGVETWTRLDSMSVDRTDSEDRQVAAERRILIELLEEKEALPVVAFTVEPPPVPVPAATIPDDDIPF